MILVRAIIFGILFVTIMDLQGLSIPQLFVLAVILSGSTDVVYIIILLITKQKED